MVKFIPNPLGIEALKVSPFMVYGMNSVAEDVADRAQSIAPVLTGAYRDSIHAESGIEGGTARGRVVADDEAAPYIEFGTSDTPTFATLRRALEGTGI